MYEGKKVSTHWLFCVGGGVTYVRERERLAHCWIHTTMSTESSCCDVFDFHHSAWWLFCHSRMLPVDCHVQKWLNNKCLLMNYWGTHPKQQANHCAASGKWQLNCEGHLSHYSHREVQCSHLGMHLAVGHITKRKYKYFVDSFGLPLNITVKTLKPSLQILTRKNS